MKRLHVRHRVVMKHDGCTSGTSRVITVESLQRFKMEALIPAPDSYTSLNRERGPLASSESLVLFYFRLSSDIRSQGSNRGVHKVSFSLGPTASNPFIA